MKTGKPPNLVKYLPCKFYIDASILKRHNTKTSTTNLLYSPHHIAQDISVRSMKLDHWFYCTLPGETIQNSKTDGTSSYSNKPSTSVICTQSCITCNNILHKTKTSCKHVGKSGAKKGDTEWPEQRNVRREKGNQKVYKIQLPQRQEATHF
jgi:hypothetical protein